MKKFTSVLVILSTIFLFSFSKIINKDTLFESKAKWGSCPAPTNLSASKNGTSVTLSWSSGAYVHSYGGYYNYYDQFGSPATQNFGGSTNTYPISINVPASTYTLTFTATADCGDGTFSASSPSTFNF